MDGYKTPKKTKHIGDLFDKYKNHFKPPQASVEKVFVKVVKEKIGIEIDQKFIEYQPANRTLYLKIPSIVKTQIKIKEKEILKATEKDLGLNNSPKQIV